MATPTDQPDPWIREAQGYTVDQGGGQENHIALRRQSDTVWRNAIVVSGADAEAIATNLLLAINGPPDGLSLVATDTLAKAILDRVDVGAVVLRANLREGLSQCMGESTGDAQTLIGLLFQRIMHIAFIAEACKLPVPPEFTAGPGEDVEEPPDDPT